MQRSALYEFGAVPAHGMPFPAYRDTVIVDGEIVLIDRWPAAFAVKVDEWSNFVFATVFVISHGIMGGIQQKFVHIRLRQELLHGIPVIKEAEGIMPRGGAEKGEDGQVIFRIRGSEHIQVIAEVETPPVGIPSDVTVRLAVRTGAFTVPYSFFKAVAGTFFPFLSGGINRRAVCTGCAGTICLFDQGRGAPHFLSGLSTRFMKKVGGIYKKGISEAT